MLWSALVSENLHFGPLLWPLFASLTVIHLPLSLPFLSPLLQISRCRLCEWVWVQLSAEKGILRFCWACVAALTALGTVDIINSHFSCWLLGIHSVSSMWALPGGHLEVFNCTRYLMFPPFHAHNSHSRWANLSKVAQSENWLKKLESHLSSKLMFCHLPRTTSCLQMASTMWRSLLRSLSLLMPRRL